MSEETARRSARLGMASMTLAMGLFASNDALVKATAVTVPVAQTMAVRGLFATLAVLAFIAVARPKSAFSGVASPLVTLRSLSEALGIFCLIVAFTRLPIGDVTAVSQSVPLLLLPAAAIVLKERITLAQWGLVLLGFFGILLIAKPTAAGFDPTMGLVLITLVCFAFRDLTARRLPLSISNTAVTLSTVGVVMIIAAAVATAQGFVPMTRQEVLQLALSGVLLAGGQAAVMLAFRLGSVADVGPFNYTKSFFALTFGVAFFGERPDLMTFAGMGLVVVSGLCVALGIGRSRG
ncbi:MAG: DMT family transporter [Phreatobacter sp.]|uniref:DMT family transporter n=1 Tax=Phreatobacter sp. TaxID=1966341 RepID=UPI001A3CE52A|nr:DMT family transporter [Phreatobacter sp.]MBL8571524.1 DMT family transporter [Phreatobacter sp.]